MATWLKKCSNARNTAAKFQVTDSKLCIPVVTDLKDLFC